PGGVVAACSTNLRERELGERGLALRACSACDADGVRRESLGFLALVVIEERERKEPASLRTGRLVASGPASVGGPHAPPICEHDRLLGEDPCPREITRIERVTGLYQRRNTYRHGVSEK